MNYYYLDETKSPQGPIPIKQMINLIEQGSIDLETYVAAEGQENWRHLRDVLPTLNAPTPTPPASRDSNSEVAEALPRPLSWVTALVFYALATAGSILVGVVELGDPEGADVLCILLLPLMILATTFFWILHYKCWCALPKEYRETTPGKAVGFMFIPLFNFVWGFVTWPKLVKGLQAWQKNKSVRESDLSTLSMIFPILFILMWTIGLVPGLSVIITIIDLTVFIILYGQLHSAINQMILVEHQTNTRS